ncbi:hypothetical protein ACVILH_004341 [Bradyrhizobium sp. USDA 4353]
MGGLHQSRDLLPVDGDVHQGRRGVDVVVPDVVMHPLPRPDDLAGLEIERRRRGGERDLLGAVAAPVVRGGAGDREIDQSERLIDRHARPHIGGAGARRDVRRQRGERPLSLAGLRIDGEDGAGRRFGIGPVLAGPAENDVIAGDRRRLQQRQRIFVVDVVPLVDVEDALVREALAELSGIGVHGEELRVHGAEIDDLLARLAGDGIGRLPIGDAAVLQRRLCQRLQRRLGIEGPFDLAGPGVQRDHAIERRADVQRVVCKDGGGGPDAGRPLAGAVGHITGVILPDLHQRFDVVGRDLSEGRVLLRVELAVEGIPRGLRRDERDRLRRGQVAGRLLRGGVGGC